MIAELSPHPPRDGACQSESGTSTEIVMTIRTTSRTVRFNAPFFLRPIEGSLLPGTYEVETDEEEHETLSRTAYVRVATLFTVKRAGTSTTHRIDPAELDAALMRDGQQPLTPGD